jgi:hypothetical protein
MTSSHGCSAGSERKLRGSRLAVGGLLGLIVLVLAVCGDDIVAPRADQHQGAIQLPQAIPVDVRRIPKRSQDVRGPNSVLCFVNERLGRNGDKFGQFMVETVFPPGIVKRAEGKTKPYKLTLQKSDGTICSWRRA